MLQKFAFILSLFSFSAIATASDDFDLDDDSNIPTDIDTLDDIDDLPEASTKKVKKSTSKVITIDEDEEEAFEIDMSAPAAEKAPVAEPLNFDLPTEKAETVPASKAETPVAPVKENVDFSFDADDDEDDEEIEVKKTVNPKSKTTQDEKDLDFNIVLDDEE